MHSDTPASSLPSSKVIQTLLIANRGEIACRIIKTANRLGIRTAAIYSDVDAQALHVQLADVAVCVGGARSVDSYLNMDAIVQAAVQVGADAIHPGYGFLSENPVFVERCEQQGLIFVGPSANAMRAMGLKDAAKALMEKAGVPVVPGYHGDNQEPSFLAKEAERIGYPVLIKARAGGGGKGMRRVDLPAAFSEALLGAKREAAASFSDDAVLIEKYIESPRHIEVQVFGDTHGNVVHLFERDCSLQRRHQKVIEEAPAPGMTDAMREAMTQAAIRTAQSIGYVGAGTVEFIVDASAELRPDGFWFMEMNTRLQVEHPVTELVTGFDLVEWQLLVASGEPLPVAQEAIALNGHAVEARLYAEDVPAGFLPATGRLTRFHLDDSLGRVDTGVVEGDEVLPYYDPMLAKLISHAANRSSALGKLANMLERSVVFGVVTNRTFLSQLCRANKVMNAKLDTTLIEQLSPEFAQQDQDEQASHGGLSDELATAAVLLSGFLVSNQSVVSSVFQELGLWQLWGKPRKQVSLMDQAEEKTVIVERLDHDLWHILFNEQRKTLRMMSCDIQGQHWLSSVEINGFRQQVEMLKCAQDVSVRVGCQQRQFFVPIRTLQDDAGSVKAVLVAPMPGRVVSLNCKVGDTVSKGQLLMTLEAMKMEHGLLAEREGVIAQVAVVEDEQVNQGFVLLHFQTDD